MIYPGVILLSVIITLAANAQSPLPPPLIEGQPREGMRTPNVAPTFPGNGDQVYLVYWRGNPMQLEAIRRLVPTAVIQQYQGETVIQAGIYPDELTAFEQAERLRQRGYPFEVGRTSLVNDGGRVRGQFPPLPPGNFPGGTVEYWVFVNGNSPLLLQQIQQVVPDAFTTEIDGRRAIQAGAFREEGNARERLNQLRSRGIFAEVVTMSGGRVAAAPAGVPAVAERTGITDRGYYVVIPGSDATIDAIANRVRQIVPNANAIARRSRRGSHVAIGPYPHRSKATEISLVLQNAGLTNARVYFGR